MKRYIVLMTAALSAALLISGCGKKDNSEQTSKESESMTTESTQLSEETEKQSAGDYEFPSETTDQVDEDEKDMRYAQTKTNIRSGAGTNYDVIGVLAVNDLVKVVSEPDDNGWIMIDCTKGCGYCKEEYLGKEEVKKTEVAKASEKTSQKTSEKTSEKTSQKTSEKETQKKPASEKPSSEKPSSEKPSSQKPSSESEKPSESKPSEKEPEAKPVSGSRDYELLPDRLYDAVDLDYLELHHISFSMDADGKKVSFHHNESSCPGCAAGETYNKDDIYK